MYFTAYLTHYFYSSKTKGDRKKQTSDSESVSKNTLPETSILSKTLLNSSTTKNFLKEKI